MARIRTIKPEFFMDEDLAELTPLHRLLFIGLWTEADREGRLQDKPRSLKARLLPWEACEIEPLLGDLDRAGLIHRYEAAGVHLIAIPNFQKHQRPHPKETGNGFPPPPSREKKRQAPNARPTMPHATRVVTHGEGKEILESGKEILEIAAKKPAAPKVPTEIHAPADARHGPTRDLLKSIFRQERGADLGWDGKAGRHLAELLEANPTLTPAEIAGAWRNALRETHFPKVATVGQLRDQLPHFIGTGPPKSTAKGFVDESVFTKTTEAPF